MEFVSALRDSMTNLHHWALSSTIPVSDSSQKQQTLIQSQRYGFEKKRERISESRTSEEEENYWFIFGFEARNQQTEPDSKSSWNFSSKSPNKTQVTIKNSPLHTCQSQRSWINANSWDFEQVWFKTV